MTEDVIKFALLGLGSAAVTALLASGMVVIYRGSGVINFAQSSFAVVGGYAYLQFTTSGVPTAAAVVAAVGVAAACGLATELCVMWPMRRSSPLARIVATLAIAAVISETVQIMFGDAQQYVQSFLPTAPVRLGGSIVLPQDRIWLLGIAAVIAACLWAGYRWSRFGLATSAGAADQEAVSALGWSPRTIAAANWTIGAGLAGFAGVLMVALNGVSQEALALAIIPAMSAALVGGFASFPLTFLGAVIVGVMQSETSRFAPSPSWSVVGPFLLIVVILVARNKTLPERSFTSDKLPAVGTGRLSPVGIALALGSALVVIYLTDATWSKAITASAIAAIICLSLVVVTGYAGQISLTQYALSGVGALISSRFAAAFGVPFFWAVLVGILATVLIGVVVALPALRARGLSLAVVTLGFATVIDSVVLANLEWTGGITGTQVEPPEIFGIPVNAIAYPERYAIVCVIACAVTAVLVANIRRGRVGRLLLAVRENERASASLGISTFTPKFFGFAVGAGIAALAGGLTAFQYSTVDFTSYSPIVDVGFVMLVVIGGLGYIAGGITGGTLVTAGLAEVVLSQWFLVTDAWQLILSLFLLVQLVFTPDGLVRHQVEAIARFRARFSRSAKTQPLPRLAGATTTTVAPKILELRDVVVQYGGTRALDGVSLSVRPGEVVGLIGPNGAGKTTLIDAVTGFTKVRSGDILVDGSSVVGVSPQQRTRRGVSRSWQSQELFNAMTVEENLRSATDRGGLRDYLLEPLWPRKGMLTPTTIATVRQFELDEVLGSYPESLPYAVRRIVGIARAVASAPSVLLLDEPAAGLDEGSTRDLGELIRRLAREWQMGILLVEHDVSLVMSICDRVVAIDFGREITSGTPEEVREDPGVVSAYLGGGDDVAEPTPPDGDDEPPLGGLVVRAHGNVGEGA